MSQDLLKYLTALLTNACGFGEGFQVYSYSKKHGGKENHPYPTLVIYVYDGRQTFVQTSFTAGTIWVSHCVSNMNTRGSLKLTLLCIDLDCTRLFKFDFTVLQTWMHVDLQSWLHCASIMNASGSANLTSLCIGHECTWSGVSMCFNLEHTLSHKTEYIVSSQNIILLSMGCLFHDY